jgi:hypothetical protein
MRALDLRASLAYQSVRFASVLGPPSPGRT